MVGIPCSGKSTRAREISNYLQNEKQMDVQIVNEESLGLSKPAYLSDPTQEKILRASLKSNVEKNLDQSRVVILDSMNYIKGYRYELYCLARNSMTTLCLVYCDTSKDIARQWCEQMQHEEAKGDQVAPAFPIDLFDDYASRMEFPNPAKRWDQPLFHLRADEPIPFEEIHAAISDTAKNKPKDPVSTKPE